MILILAPSSLPTTNYTSSRRNDFYSRHDFAERKENGSCSQTNSLSNEFWSKSYIVCFTLFNSIRLLSIYFFRCQFTKENVINPDQCGKVVTKDSRNYGKSYCPNHARAMDRRQSNCVFFKSSYYLY